MGVRGDRFVSQVDEVDDVRGHDRAAFASRVLELRAVVQVDVAEVVGAGGIDAVPRRSSATRECRKYFHMESVCLGFKRGAVM
jgi:hypothetical protein